MPIKAITNEEHATNLELLSKSMPNVGPPALYSLLAGAAALRKVEELKAALEIWQRYADHEAQFTERTAYTHAAAVLKRIEE